MNLAQLIPAVDLGGILWFLIVVIAILIAVLLVLKLMRRL